MKRLIIFLLIFSSCSGPEKVEVAAKPAGDAARGKIEIEQAGCTACHAIPGVEGPRGMIGPALENIAAKPTIAGQLPNSRENLARWIQNPQAFEPGNTMPTLGLSEEQVRDIAAYLWTR